MSPGAQEAKKAGFMEPSGGNQEKVCSLAAWALSWERGVLGSLHITEAVDKNKNKLKYEFQIARTPGLNEHASPQGNKFLLKRAPTTSMNRIPFPSACPASRRRDLWTT